ncbi:MAG: aspartate--tRNA ligase, partial [Peptococcaceae bacterium]|nr:aspartate--tRNA ligase [Peptococcaceae bacterium]
MTLLSQRTEAHHLTGLDQAGQTVSLLGWVQRRRDHGGVIFVDMRDRSGIVQIVFNPDMPDGGFVTAEKLRNEFVISVRGVVRQRPAGQENLNLDTGQIEVTAEYLAILNTAKTPPFYIQDQIDVDEPLRLKHRYLDLRRPEMFAVFAQRHRVVQTMRNFFDRQGFLELETPMLGLSSPEGARDYL